VGGSWGGHILCDNAAAAARSVLPGAAAFRVLNTFCVIVITPAAAGKVHDPAAAEKFLSCSVDSNAACGGINCWLPARALSVEPTAASPGTYPLLCGREVPDAQCSRVDLRI
jgi:hypothetical protein